MKVSNLYSAEKCPRTIFLYTTWHSKQPSATCGMKDWQKEGLMKLHHLSMTMVLSQWVMAHWWAIGHFALGLRLFEKLATWLKKVF